jgi:hypothetical protein
MPSPIHTHKTGGTASRYYVHTAQYLEVSQ